MVHRAIHNKPVWNPDFAENWEEVQDPDDTLMGLRKLVSEGKAFIPVRMTSHKRTSSAFDFADLVVADIDNGLSIAEFLQHPLAQHACWVYTTSSHGSKPEDRFRVIFKLPERVKHPDIYKAVVTLLVKSLGADRNCTDPCRLFYGNDKAEHPLWQPKACLPESILEDAIDEAKRRRAQELVSTDAYDDVQIERAIFVLQTVLEPTVDGDRDRFTKITAACRAAGDRLFPYWSDWASRGHHGKGKNAKQATQKFFRGFNGSGLASLFFMANEESPGWRDRLPDELKHTSESSLGVFGKSFAGYGHEDFLLDPNEDFFNPPDAQDRSDTQSLFDSERPWTHVAQVSRPEPEEPEWDDEEDHDDPTDHPTELEVGEYEPVPRVRNAGRARADADEQVVEQILTRLRRIYPGLRLNSMSQQLEYGPIEKPLEIDDVSTAYVRISAGAGTVFPKTLTYDVAMVAGRENAYHPVRTYLEDTCSRVEPCPYFDKLATTLLGVKGDNSGGIDIDITNPLMPCGNTLADVVMKRFLVGAVARALEPGCVHDWMPILIGPQNCGKTTFMQYLTPPSPVDPGIYPWVSTIQQGITYLKDRPHVLHAGWIVVMDECERFFKRKDVEDLKNLISTNVDRSARKYENERSYPRSFVLAACANSEELFVDPTGNRRFMPIRVTGVVPSEQDPRIKIIDLDRLKRDRDSIWAAAYRCYLDDPTNTFTSYEIQTLNNYMQSFAGDSPLEHDMVKALSRQYSGILNKPGHARNGKRYWLMSQIFKWMDIASKDEASMIRGVSDILKRRGFAKERLRYKGKILNAWFNDDPFFNRNPNELGPDWD